MESVKKKAKTSLCTDKESSWNEALNEYRLSEMRVRSVLLRWKEAIKRKDKSGLVAVFEDVVEVLPYVHWGMAEEIKTTYLEPSENILKGLSSWKELRRVLREWDRSNQDYKIKGWKPVKWCETVEKTETSVGTDVDVAARTFTPSGKGLSVPQKSPSGKGLSVPQKSVQIDSKGGRKTFSLRTLIGSKSKEAKCDVTTSSSRTSAPQQVRQKKEALPTWLSGSISVEPPKDDPRALGLEFLQQATPSIPMSKGVDHDAIALALEAAIFKSVKSDHQSKWVQKYWEKIDSIGVAISGDKEVGTIASMIGQGLFASAEDVVQLSDDDIHNSFYGKEVILR